MTQELATVRPQVSAMSVLPSSGEWNQMVQIAETIVKSGLAPQDVKTPQQALVIMLKARELGVPPMQALSTIYVVKGKPTLSSDLMVALLRREGHKVWVTVTSDKVCTMRGHRLGEENRTVEITFTIEDANKAQITGSPTWKNYPAQMLYARCSARICRMLAPDVLAGMYTPDELQQGGNVSDGMTITVEPVVVENPAVEAKVSTLPGHVIPAPTGKTGWKEFQDTLRRLMPKLTPQDADAKVAGVFGYENVKELMKGLEAAGIENRFHYITTRFEKLLAIFKALKVKGDLVAAEFGHETFQGLATELRDQGVDNLPFEVIKNYLTIRSQKETGFNWVWDAENETVVESEDVPFDKASRAALAYEGEIE